MQRVLRTLLLVGLVVPLAVTTERPNEWKQLRRLLEHAAESGVYVDVPVIDSWWVKHSVFQPPMLDVPEAPPEHVEATAYCGCPECCGKWSTPEAITASGIPALEGVTIAADWSVFPAGTCVKIAGIGKRIVQDTGSAIKGARIDVFFESHEEAKEFGRKKKLGVTQC